MEADNSPTFEKHIYDLDIVAAVNAVARKLAQTENIANGMSRQEYINRLWSLVIEICKSQHLPYSIPKKKCPLMVIVDSNNNFYLAAMSIDLLWRPVDDIEMYLDYQLENHKKQTVSDKVEFVGWVQYKVKSMIRNNSPFKVQKRLNTINRWLQTAKSVINLSLSDQESSKLDNSEKFLKITICKEIQEKLYLDLEPYFNIDDWQNLKTLINGEVIKGKLLFKGQVSVLGCLFSELYAFKKIDEPGTVIADWIVENFNYLNNKTEKGIDRGYVYQFIYGGKKPRISKAIKLTCLE